MKLLMILLSVMALWHVAAGAVLVFRKTSSMRIPWWLTAGECDSPWWVLLILVSQFDDALPTPWYFSFPALLAGWLGSEYLLWCMMRWRRAKRPRGAPDAALLDCLLGGAAGDSMGLPYERLSPRTVARMREITGQSLFWRYGTVSDDTEQTVLVAEALSRNPRGDAVAFLKDFSRTYRRWILWNPWTSGRASLLSGVKLWFGCPPTRSGIASAGNAPAMRSAVIGVYYAGEPETRRHFVRASTRMTHTDMRAEIGAQAVASLAAYLTKTSAPSPEEIILLLREEGPNEPEWQTCVSGLEQKCRLYPHGQKPSGYDAGDKGVSGYVYATVIAAIYLWYSSQSDYEKIILSAIHHGGDTDTVAAIAGALAGIQAGAEAIPPQWLHGIKAYPYSPAYLKQLATHPYRFQYWMLHLRLLAMLLLCLVLLWNIVERGLIAAVSLFRRNKHTPES